MTYPDNWREKLDAVNSAVNALPYQADADRYQQEEFWEEIDKDGGDCEDYALGKLNRLHAYGYPIEALRLATCVMPYGLNIDNPGGGHAVLVVDSPDRQYVLSNGLGVMPLSRFLAMGFKPIAIQSVGGSRTWVEWEA